MGHLSSKLQLAHELWRCKPLTPRTRKRLAPRSGLSEMSTEHGPQAGIKEFSATHASGEALSMEASREVFRTPRRLPLCSDVSVLHKTRMSHFWDTHHRLYKFHVLQAGLPYWHQFGAAAVGEGPNARHLGGGGDQNVSYKFYVLAPCGVPGKSGRIRGLVAPAEAGYK